LGFAMMASSSKKALIAVFTLISAITASGILFRTEIYFHYNAFVYEKEISYARKWVSLLKTANTEEIEKIFIENSKFLKNPVYIKETSEFLKDVDVDELVLERISSGVEDNSEVIFLDFFTPDRDDTKSIRLKMINRPNGWLLYSIMIG